MEKTFLIPAFALYCLAAVVYLLRWRRVAIGIFFLATALNGAAVGYRWVDAGHLPFSNMFETMMTLGFCMFPFLLFTEYGLKERLGWIDALLAATMVFPSCFIFSDEIKHLPPALQSPLFFPHVITYLLSYAALAKAMILSVLSLAKRRGDGWVLYEKAAFRMTALGFPMLTLGLLLGAYWAQQAWGDYWSWDPKEMWALNTWFVYIVYFHLRLKTRGRSFWVDVVSIFGFLVIVVTLLAVNLSGIFGGGLHSYA